MPAYGFQPGGAGPEGFKAPVRPMALLRVWSDVQRTLWGTWTVGQGFLEEVALCPGPERE